MCLKQKQNGKYSNNSYNLTSRRNQMFEVESMSDAQKVGVSTDPFGIRSEERIDDSGIRKIFTPHRPIDSIEHFFGRQEEVRGLISQMNTPGQHSLLFGDRGIGKSSLATVSAAILFNHLTQGKVHIKRCSRSDTFETILAPLLKFFGLLDVPDEVTIQSATTNEASLKLPYAEGKKGYSNQVAEKWKHDNNFSPSVVAEMMRKRHAILIIDETDAIVDLSDRFKLGEFVKHLSDNNSSVKLLIVGIASTGSDLLSSHPSVGRCLKETKLEKMADEEIRRIVESGQKRGGLHFEKPIVDTIVSISAGYPHFTHLLCLKAAEIVIGREDNVIDEAVFKEAMRRSVQDVEGSLKNAFDRATRSMSTDVYKLLLFSAATMGKREFKASEWRERYASATGRVIKQTGLNNYLSRLVTDPQSAVLERVARGMYRFIDPRMPSFVRIEASRNS